MVREVGRNGGVGKKHHLPPTGDELTWYLKRNTTVQMVKSQFKYNGTLVRWFRLRATHIELSLQLRCYRSGNSGFQPRPSEYYAGGVSLAKRWVKLQPKPDNSFYVAFFKLYFFTSNLPFTITERRDSDVSFLLFSFLWKTLRSETGRVSRRL